MEPDSEYDNNTARDRTCVGLRTGTSGPSPDSKSLPLLTKFGLLLQIYQLLLNRHTLYCVICAGKIFPNLSFLSTHLNPKLSEGTYATAQPVGRGQGVQLSEGGEAEESHGG